MKIIYHIYLPDKLHIITRVDVFQQFFFTSVLRFFNNLYKLYALHTHIYIVYIFYRYSS